MREIPKEEADRLIESGLAGFYAIWANPPKLHDVQYVLQIENRYWLIPVEKLTIKEVGIVEIGGLPKMMHNVEMDLPVEIIDLLQDELARQLKIDLGLEIPAYHTQKLSDNS